MTVADDASQRAAADTPTLDAAVEARVREHFAGIATLRTLGVSLAVLRPGHCEMHLPISAPYLQQHGYLHGGIIGTVADSASGHAALTLVPLDHGVITVEFKVNFLSPAAGERVVVRADVLKGGRTLIVSEAHAYAVQAGRETRCASAIVTYIALPPRG